MATVMLHSKQSSLMPPFTELEGESDHVS